ncbi:hypothetical protein [Rhodococcus ruber]|uniref:hypothetical protein n=1 Tax=Rhodococcus ruber TaxID=1830 RepID=UPI00126835CB|nr:hypothetical protein [Rhodococcus ruber]
MTNQQITVSLEGTDGTIDPLALADAIQALDKIVRSLAGESEAVLVLSDLRIGSAHLGVRTDDRRAELLTEGLGALRRGAVLPTGWNLDTLDGLVELQHAQYRRGVEDILIAVGNSIERIDRELVGLAESTLMLEGSGAGSASLGSVRGTLYRYTNDSSRRTAALRDYRTGRAIEIRFPAHMAQTLKSLLDHEVEAWGELHRDKSDRIIRLKLEGMEAIAGPHPQATLDEVAGILGRDWTAGMDPADWVRHQRDQ